MIARLRIDPYLKLIKRLTFTVLVLFLAGCEANNLGMLNPKGIITFQERKLLFDTLALMLIVVLPVIVMSLVFVFHYRASQRHTDYRPNWAHSYFLESIWWGVPLAIIVILAVITWKSTHELDPYKRITTAAPNEIPMQIQAIALPWKWLFIYPEHHIATINYVELPRGHQVEFLMTTDNAPMSALFIPQLGSQIYAMAGMTTRLHLFANEVGTYDGMDTLYNGEGFSDMHFVVHVSEMSDMQAWIKKVKSSKEKLDEKTYQTLLQHSIKNKPQFFSDVPKDLFKNVLTLYQTTFGKYHPHDPRLQEQKE